MSNRLNQEREAKLQPLRMQAAIKELTELGKQPIQVDETCLMFVHMGKQCNFFPYSGWHTGSTIKDGRGLQNLLKQLK